MRFILCVYLPFATSDACVVAAAQRRTVAVIEGETALTRTPWYTIFAAPACVSPSTPAFAAWQIRRSCVGYSTLHGHGTI